MQITDTIQSDPRVEFYGDELQRLEELRALEYPEFKQQLFDIHNSVTLPEEHSVQFVQTANGNMGGQFYPRPDDKDWLMQYALEQAQQQDSIQDAALILGMAVVFTHPFGDGNGRTSRTLYGRLSRGYSGQEPVPTESWLTRQNGVGSKIIDFGKVDGRCGRIINELVYEDQGIEPLGQQIWPYSSDEVAAKNHYGAREYHGLSEQKIKAVDSLFGVKAGSDGHDPERYSANNEAVLYGFSKIAQEDGLDIPKREFGPDRTAVITPDALAAMTGDQKWKLAGYIREYNTLRAKAAIDLVGKHGNDRVQMGNTETMSMKDFVVSNSRNYQASKLGGPVVDKIIAEFKALRS